MAVEPMPPCVDVLPVPGTRAASRAAVVDAERLARYL
jgi:hypothetical protein